MNLLFLVAELGEERDDTTQARTVSAKDASKAIESSQEQEPLRVVGIRWKVDDSNSRTK